MTKEFIRKPTIFPLETELPWNIVDNLCTIISHIIETLDDSYSWRWLSHRCYNAVLSPGTLLKPKTIVKRLALIEQDPL